MRTMPKDGDIAIEEEPGKGRCLVARKKFYPGNVLGWYGGHHVNSQGTIVFARPAVTALMRQYPIIDRHVQGTPFQTTHAIWVKRVKTSGVMIDGGPMSHPALDHVQGVGKMSLANSANFKDSTMLVHLLLLFHVNSPHVTSFHVTSRHILSTLTHCIQAH